MLELLQITDVLGGVLHPALERQGEKKQGLRRARRDVGRQAGRHPWRDGSDFGLVGDNTRKSPYADIYSRITTKSNVYSVFYRGTDA